MIESLKLLGAFKAGLLDDKLSPEDREDFERMQAMLEKKLEEDRKRGLGGDVNTDDDEDDVIEGATAASKAEDAKE